ncbi:MAG TPA: hypothetical protein VF718_07025 [Allosphingosinicella sp.]
MNGFEYALALLSVLIGLTLTEIATDLHRLVRRGRAVRWDGRVVLSTALAVEVTVRMWFTFWRVRDVEAVVVFPFYLSMFVEMMVLFMIGASCLPEEPPEDGDLSLYYERNRRTLWTLFALFQASYVGYALYFNRGGGPRWAWSIILLPLALYVLLAAVGRKWLHYAAPAAILAWELFWNWDRALGTPGG